LGQALEKTITNERNGRARPCHIPAWNKKKKILVNKNQGWEPIIKSTRQMRTQVNTTPRANNQQKSGKDLIKRGLMTMK